MKKRFLAALLAIAMLVVCCSCQITPSETSKDPVSRDGSSSVADVSSQSPVSGSSSDEASSENSSNAPVSEDGSSETDSSAEPVSEDSSSEAESLSDTSSESVSEDSENQSSDESGNPGGESSAESEEDNHSPSNKTNPLVLSINTLDGKFNPFFFTSAYDGDVVDLTQIGLLAFDKDGAPVSSVEGNAVEPSLCYAYTQKISSENSSTTYKFILKNGVKFSDGTPVTARDALFSIYVLCDPLYDGASTFYALDIKGLTEYRLQTSAEQTDMAEAIMNAGISVDGIGIPTNGINPDDQVKFWSYLSEAGKLFAKEIVDFIMKKYATDGYVQNYFNKDLTIADVKASESLTIAYCMTMWGYGTLKPGNSSKFICAVSETEYKVSELTYAKFFDEIFENYGYDLSTSGINYESAGTPIERFCFDLYIQNECGVEGGVDSISGITSGKEKCADGVEREYIQIIINGIDPVAIFQCGIYVCQRDYYTKGFTGKTNEFGVAVNDKAFVKCLKDKNGKPVGAGPYVFQKFTDNVVYYTANEHFLLGAPIIKNLRYMVINSGSEFDAVKTGTVHFSAPSASYNIINDISKGEGDYAKLDYILVDNDGYGYIGIQARLIPEFEVRQAIAHTLNVQLAIDNYYGELASVNYRTMTKIQWAYPDSPKPVYPYDGTGATSKALFLKAGYVYDEATKAMLYPEGHAKAGTQVEFDFFLPSDASDHPAGTIFLNAQHIMSGIGVKVNIKVDMDILDKLNTAYENGIMVWAAAWGNGGTDPDMFQIWYSDPAKNQGASARRSGLYYLFEKGSYEEKTILKKLNKLIIEGRSTLDIEERKQIYKEALELASKICVEVPTYQRKNMYVYNKEIINADSLITGDDATPFQSPLGRIWAVELN